MTDYANTMKTRILALALLQLILLTPGCSYFRWNEPTYDELHDRAQKEKTAPDKKFDPDTAFDAK
jgi:hypothetical protein